MTERTTHESSDEQLPEALVQPRDRLSLVWLIPLVALVIGAWLAYKAFSEQGPTITITFKTAEGLEAGKTKVRFKDVEVGQVKDIQLAEDLSKVVVTAQLVKGAKQYLSDKTRFWVVRARVAGGQVSGLSTLLAGAYIGIDPNPEGEPVLHFTGLEIPPVVTIDDPGRHFMLHANELGSLQIGVPVYFRRIKVGEVVAFELDKSGQNVDIQVFVRAPHDERVRRNTQFWNASGVNVSLNASGLEIDTQSLISIMIGGVAFETPAGLDPGAPATEGDVFELHRDRKSAFQKTYVRKGQWQLNFTGSAKGLSVGAPVEFKGIQLGEVTHVRVEFDLEKATARIPVLIAIEPERLHLVNDETKNLTGEALERARREVMNRLVAKGLRAQLKTGNLLTGAMYVALDMYPKAPPGRIVWRGDHPVLPTVPTPIQELKNVVAEALEKFQNFPVEQMGEDLSKSLKAMRQTIVQMEKLVNQLNSKVAPELTATLAQTQKTLKTAEQALSPKSTLQQDAQQMLRELGAAARSIRVLADYLERHPEALIQGKGGMGR